MFCDTLLVFDQVRRQVTAVAYADHRPNSDPAAARAALKAGWMPWKPNCSSHCRQA